MPGFGERSVFFNRVADILLFLRAWGGRALAAGLLATVLILLVLSPDPIEVFGKQGVRYVIWPLIPTIYAIMIPISASSSYRELELVAPRSQRVMRVMFSGLMVLGVLMTALFGFRFEPGIILRNGIGLLGLSLGSAAVLPQALAWVPPFLVSATMWLFGTHELGEVSSWAVLLQPLSSESAMIASVCSLLVGAGSYCLLQRRGSRQR